MLIVHAEAPDEQKAKEWSLFAPVGLFEFVIYVLHRFPKTDGDNNHIVVITERFLKLAKAIPTAKTTAARATNIFMDHEVASFKVL